MPAPYSNRELDERFKAHENLDAQRFDVVSEKMDDHFGATIAILKDIKDQVMKMDGRTTKLENRNYYVAGAIAVFIMVVLPALGVLSWQVIESKTEIAALQAK